METTQRFASGMSFNPDREMRLFSIQARKGCKLTGVSLDTNGWLFESAPAQDSDFDIAYQDDTDADAEYFQMYQAAGWEHVLSHGRIHVFRAPQGTAPVEQARLSRLTELTSQRNKFARYALVGLVALAAVLAVISFFELGDAIEALLFALVAFPTVYVVIPALGYTRQVLAMNRTR